MPGIVGLGLIVKFSETEVRLPHFILDTAYYQYALEALRWEALDYLLKPIEKDRLTVAGERARKVIAEKAKNVQPELALQPRTGAQRTKLLVKNSNRNFIVN